jgi:hypothetical protein
MVSLKSIDSSFVGISLLARQAMEAGSYIKYHVVARVFFTR